VVQECFKEGVDLAVHGWYHPEPRYYYQYTSYGVTCSEVELDVLTGEHNIARVDILFDCGERQVFGMDSIIVAIIRSGHLSGEGECFQHTYLIYANPLFRGHIVNTYQKFKVHFVNHFIDPLFDLTFCILH